MQPNDHAEPTPSRLACVLTDIHFWVPLTVLIGGLLLLKAIH